jgi:nucleotide-binding universal stress UspA family protein
LDKLTNILAVVNSADTGPAVIDKSVALARRFCANVEVLASDAALVEPLREHCAYHRFDAVIFLDPAATVPMDSDILRAVDRRHIDLVIKAATGAHPLRRWTLDVNDRQLAQRCAVPLLLVGDKPWGTSPRMAACVDVTDSSSLAYARALLQAAGFLATGSRAFLDVLYSEREHDDERIRMERAVRLAQLVREFYMGSERLQMFNGAPEKTLPPMITARQYDLIAIGADTHRSGLATWPESLSSRLTDATPGDVLLVKPAAPSAPLAVPVSAAQQHAHLA